MFVVASQDLLHNIVTYVLHDITYVISANNKLLWQKSNIIITVIIYLTDHMVHIADISILKLHHLNWKFPMFCKKHWCWNDIFMKLNKWIPLMSWINPVGAFKYITYHQLTLYSSNKEKCLILFHWRKNINHVFVYNWWIGSGMSITVNLWKFLRCILWKCISCVPRNWICWDYEFSNWAEDFVIILKILLGMGS